MLAAILPQILPALVALIAALIAMATSAVKKKANADTAWGKLANLGVALAGKAWDRLGPEVQTALADGKITAEERAHIEDVALKLLDEVTDRATLEQIANAVGLPVPGIIAWIASNFIDTWTKAHDPANTEVSVKAFPAPSTASDLAAQGAG